MFGEVEEHDRLMPYDSSALAVTGLPVAVKNGIEGDIRWIVDEPVLPPLENYLVLTLTSRDGMKIGDELELFKPREKSSDVGEPSLPEIHVGTVQVVRVTPLGSTVRITALEQPKGGQRDPGSRHQKDAVTRCRQLHCDAYHDRVRTLFRHLLLHRKRRRRGDAFRAPGSRPGQAALPRSRGRRLSRMWPA